MRQAINNLVMLRTRGVGGMLAQRIGENTYVHSQGAFLAPGMPGSGPQAIRGEVGDDAVTVNIYWTQCVKDSGFCLSPYGMTVTRLPSENLPISAVFFADEGKRVVIQVGPTIEPGDEISWSYDDTNGCIVSCDDEEIGDQGPLDVRNGLVLAGDFILTEEGGSSIILVEEDIDETDGINTEEAP